MHVSIHGHSPIMRPQAKILLGFCVWFAYFSIVPTMTRNYQKQIHSSVQKNHSGWSVENVDVFFSLHQSNIFEHLTRLPAAQCTVKVLYLGGWMYLLVASVCSVMPFTSGRRYAHPCRRSLCTPTSSSIAVLVVAAGHVVACLRGVVILR